MTIAYMRIEILFKEKIFMSSSHSFSKRSLRRDEEFFAPSSNTTNLEPRNTTILWNFSFCAECGDKFYPKDPDSFSYYLCPACEKEFAKE
jgi:hypothetical protein